MQDSRLEPDSNSKFNYVIELRTVPLSDIIPLASLFEEHWDEVAKNKRLMKLDPDFDRYRLIESSGKLFCIAAVAEDMVVGYSVNIVDSHIHYKGLTVASNDILYVMPMHRKTTVGLRIKRETEAVAKSLGAKLMLWHAKQGTSLDKILQAQHYPVQDIIYSKEL